MDHSSLILITGASASGKTTYSGALAARLPGPRVLVDTARADPFDTGRPPWLASMRAAGFAVFSRDTDIGGIDLPAGAAVLLECLCHLTANEMFDAEGRVSDPFSAVMDGVMALKNRSAHLIVVTNEIGRGTADCDGSTRRYVAALGRLNCALAKESDAVCELVCGIPIVLKGYMP